MNTCIIMVISEMENGDGLTLERHLSLCSTSKNNGLYIIGELTNIPLLFLVIYYKITE